MWNKLITIYNQTDEDLENAVVAISNYIGANIDESDIEACHRLPQGKTKKPKRTIVSFLNRKKAINMKTKSGKLKNIESNVLGFPHKNLYINENLCREYKNLWFQARKLHTAKLINRYQTSNGVVCIKLSENSQWLKLKHITELITLFPEFDFFENKE